MKSRHIRHHFSVETDILSHFVYELISIQVLRGVVPPSLGEKGGVKGSGVIPHEGPSAVMVLI